MCSSTSQLSQGRVPHQLSGDPISGGKLYEIGIPQPVSDKVSRLCSHRQLVGCSAVFGMPAWQGWQVNGTSVKPVAGRSQASEASGNFGLCQRLQALLDSSSLSCNSIRSAAVPPA